MKTVDGPNAQQPDQNRIAKLGLQTGAPVDDTNQKQRDERKQHTRVVQQQERGKGEGHADESPWVVVGGQLPPERPTPKHHQKTAERGERNPLRVDAAKPGDATAHQGRDWHENLHRAVGRVSRIERTSDRCKAIKTVLCHNVGSSGHERT